MTPGRPRGRVGGASGVRLVAGSLLVLMVLLLVVARLCAPGQAGLWGYLRAFAEAGLVGGLADWFAVTALFRHPLGLPIPHTAIIPANKDRIAEALAEFLRRHFLTPQVVAGRLAGYDLAGSAGAFLTIPRVGEARISAGAANLLADALAALDRERLGGMAREALSSQLARLDLAPLLGQVLAAMIAEDRHLPLIESLITQAGAQLEANEPTLRAMIRERAHGLLRFVKLDEPLANAILDGLYAMLAETLVKTDHPLRHKLNASLAQLAQDLMHDPALAVRVSEAKAALLANPAFGLWLDGLWERSRTALITSLRAPTPARAGAFQAVLGELGTALKDNRTVNRLANRLIRRGLTGLASRHGAQIVGLVSDTIRRWDAHTVTARIEQAVGRDLQFIRINGTLVGGLVGLALHALDQLI